MFNPLGALVITFVVMTLISVAGIILLYLSRNEKLQKGLFYFLAIWGLIVAYCNILTIPEYMLGSIVIACVLGLLSVAALLLQICVKKGKAFLVAKILVTVSVVVGMIDCFLI